MTDMRLNPPKTVITEDGEVWSASTKIDGQRVVIALFYDDTDAEAEWNVALLVGATRKAKKGVRQAAWWSHGYTGKTTGRIGLRALKWAMDQIDLFQSEYPDATVVVGWEDDKRRKAYAALTRYGFKLGRYKEKPVYFRTAEDFQTRSRTRRNPMSRCPISGKYVARENPGTPKVTKPNGEEVVFCCPSHKKRYLRENPGATDPQGRHIPEKYLAGLPPELRAARIKELGESRDEYGTGDFSELPTDRAARKMGLVKLSAYRVVAQQRGFDISQVSDLREMAEAALVYYGEKPTAAKVNKLAAGLEKVYAKGLAAWKSGGHRPGATGRNWADARVASVLVGGKAAWTADSKQFGLLPRAAQQKVVAQLPEVYEALAAQGRQRDINYIQEASGMSAHDNPSWADFKRGFSRAGKSAKKTAAYAQKRARLNAKLSKAKKRQAKAQAEMDYLLKCMDRLHLKPRDLNAFGRDVVESVQAEVRKTAKATADAKRELQHFVRARRNPTVGLPHSQAAAHREIMKILLQDPRAMSYLFTRDHR